MIPRHDPNRKRIEALLALAMARSTKTPAAGLASLQVINTGPVPTAGPASSFLLVLGGDGMPAPATFLSATGNVKVTVQAAVRAGTLNDLTQAIPNRDGAQILAPLILQFIADADSNGGQVSSVSLVYFDTVTPGSSHSWGARIQGINPGGGSPCQIVVAGRASILVEDH